MLSNERIRQIETEATQRAMTLSDDMLRKEAVDLHVEHNDAAEGDQRMELEIRDRVYTHEKARPEIRSNGRNQRAVHVISGSNSRGLALLQHAVSV